MSEKELISALLELARTYPDSSIEQVTREAADMIAELSGQESPDGTFHCACEFVRDAKGLMTLHLPCGWHAEQDYQTAKRDYEMNRMLAEATRWIRSLKEERGAKE